MNERPKMISPGNEVLVGKHQACAIRNFSISSKKVGGDAGGTITIFDYIENCGLDHRWKAKYSKETESWDVWCTDKPLRYSLIEENGKVGFTWMPDINLDLKIYIADRLKTETIV